MRSKNRTTDRTDYPASTRRGDGTTLGLCLAWLLDHPGEWVHYVALAETLGINANTCGGNLAMLRNDYPETVERGAAGHYRTAPPVAAPPLVPGKREYLLEVIHRESAPDGRVHRLLARDTDPGEGEPTLWVLVPFTLNGTGR